MLVAGAGLTTLYWATSRYVDSQITAGLTHQLTSLKHLYAGKGKTALVNNLRARGAIITPENHRYILYVSEDRNTVVGDLKAWPADAIPDDVVRNIWVEDSLIPHAMEDRDGYWPGIATRLPDGSLLLIAQSVRQAEDLQEFILSTLLITLFAIVGLSLVLGWRLGRQILTRIDAVIATSRKILAGKLNQRVPLSGKQDEFDELAEHLNAMLDHINRLIKGMHQVTDNVAHDLRRPLSRLRNRLDVILLEPRTTREYRLALEDTREDIDEVLKTFNALLEIAQAEAGEFRGTMAILDLSKLATELVDMYADTFSQNAQTLTADIAPGQRIVGNRQLLAQLISNVLENAHKYAGQGASIRLSVAPSSAAVVLAVCDTGPGIPTSQLKAVTQRFVRLDAARSTPGNGLGLSLVKAVAELHQAQCLLKDNHPGLCIELRFPKPE